MKKAKKKAAAKKGDKGKGKDRKEVTQTKPREASHYEHGREIDLHSKQPPE